MKISQNVIWGKFAIQLWAAVLLGAVGTPAAAQIVPDQTLGAEGSRATSNVLIRGASGDLVEGGAVRGSNLFHSFQQFNVNGNQRVYFANPVGVQNIFSRVTGSNASNILGTLGVDGNANLFLLNPNGILFGKNAQLDVRGSFLATTADRFTFPDGSTFGASNSQAAPLLTMSTPVGVQYGQVSGTIANQGNLATGQDLTLAANNLDLQGQIQSGGDLTLQAQDTVRIRDSVAQPFTATAGSKLLIQGDRSIDIFALSHPASGFFSGSDLILRSANTVGGDAHFQSGGNFRIEQMDSTAGSLFSPHDPIILADGDVTLGDYTGASLHILAGGSVTLGNISITGAGNTNDTINVDNPDPFLASLAKVELSNGNKISIDGRSLTLDVRAGVDWSQFSDFPGNTSIGTPAPLATPATSANIAVGNVNFDSDFGGMVFLSNQYLPNKSLPAVSEISVGEIDTGGNSGGGNIFIDARDHLTTRDLLITSAFSESGSSGNILLRAGGDLQVMDDLDAASMNKSGSLLGRSGNIDAWAGGSLTLKPGANILVNGTVGGDVTLKSNGDISIAKSEINASSKNDDPTLNYSQIRIESLGGSVFLSDVKINAENAGSAFAGDLIVNALNRVEIANSTISGDGYFGTISIGKSPEGGSLTPQTVIIDNSKLTTTNKLIEGAENAGFVEILATGNISIRNKSTLSTTTTGTGSGGNIHIETGSLSLEQSDLDAETHGFGAAGDILIVAKDRVALTGGRISNNLGAGAAVVTDRQGDITIAARSLSITQGGIISSSVNKAADNLPAAKGNAGTINLQIAEQTSLSGADSRIRTVIGAGAEGNGGTITLDTGSLILDNGAAISASTIGIGNAGQISITAQDDVLLQRGGRISSAVRSGAKGNASTIQLNSGSLHLTGDSQIEALVEAQAQGNGGDITLTSPDITLLNGARITADSKAIGGAGLAGNLTISTNVLKLNNKASITAGTIGGNGGSIQITARDLLLLRHNSEISTTAGTPASGGNGGKITINASKGFLIAVPKENSDVIANAFGGKGGKISISANRILGLTQRSRLTPSQLNEIRTNGTSDISASSDVGADGEISTSTLQVDPSQGLTEIPVDLVDPSSLIAQNCQPGSAVAARRSEFVITGRGGLPPSPGEAQSSDAVSVPWVNSSPSVAQKLVRASVAPSVAEPLVEAQGITIAANGTAFLTTQVTTAPPHLSRSLKNLCASSNR